MVDFFESSRSLRDEFKYLYCIDQEVDMEMSMFFFKEHRHYIETGNGFIIFHKRGYLKTVHCDCLGSDNRFHNNNFQIKITAHRVASTMVYDFCDFNISCLHIHWVPITLQCSWVLMVTQLGFRCLRLTSSLWFGCNEHIPTFILKCPLLRSTPGPKACYSLLSSKSIIQSSFPMLAHLACITLLVLLHSISDCLEFWWWLIYVLYLLSFLRIPELHGSRVN